MLDNLSLLTAYAVGSQYLLCVACLAKIALQQFAAKAILALLLRPRPNSCGRGLMRVVNAKWRNLLATYILSMYFMYVVLNIDVVSVVELFRVRRVWSVHVRSSFDETESLGGL